MDHRSISTEPSLRSTPQRVYVVILNWNGWRDTIECLESVLRLEGPQFSIVVCDNASADGSMENIVAWARGDILATETPFLPCTPWPKPLPFKRYSREVAERGPQDSTLLTLIDNGNNLGFAGGCNVGIRFALTRLDCGYVWLLNNDTVVPTDSLAQMVALCGDRPQVGICGSQVRYYDKPDIVQTFGGLLNRWFCTTHSIACGVSANTISAEPQVIDYVPGASMLVTRAFVFQVGLLSESYFLYYEEIDWAERGRGQFDLAVCLKGLVFHRGGASIGSPSEMGERGVRSEFYLLRGRVLFARKFYRSRLATVYLSLLGSIATRLRRRQWLRARTAICAFVGIRPSLLKNSPSTES